MSPQLHVKFQMEHRDYSSLIEKSDEDKKWINKKNKHVVKGKNIR